MSLKSTARTAQRIITMVESGDYDPKIIEHMVESVVKQRDKRIKVLETRVKPKTFDLSLKSISGALKDTIKAHGPITIKFIPSAAKRIHGNCQRVIDNIKPVEVEDVATRLLNGKVTVIRDKNTTHKLTVARDGNIRIKIAIGSSNEEANKIIESFTKIAVDAINLNKGTLRGKLSPDEIFKARYTSITLYNDSKSENFNFKL